MSRPLSPPAETTTALTATTALGPLQARLAAHSSLVARKPAQHAAGRAFTYAAEECVMDLIAQDHAGLVAHSADVLAELLRIWPNRVLMPKMSGPNWTAAPAWATCC